ncbi:MAG TPA: CPCC family cysteine-rich protein [Steroidobacter sp.]
MKTLISAAALLRGRECCPCCGYPTLEAGADYEICELCNWEDDGQSDADADAVRGGPNADYSLSEARLNFRQYRVMYSPQRDTRIGGSDSELERQTKGLLMEAFDALPLAADRNALVDEIRRLESILSDELHRRIREHEAKTK